MPVRLEHSLSSSLPREVTAREKTVVEGKKEPEYGEQENDSVDDGFHRGRDEREDVHEPHEKADDDESDNELKEKRDVFREGHLESLRRRPDGGRVLDRLSLLVRFARLAGRA